MSVLATLADVREYSEGMPVVLDRDEESGRIVVKAFNQDGYDCTAIDLWDLLNWLKCGNADTQESWTPYSMK